MKLRMTIVALFALIVGLSPACSESGEQGDDSRGEGDTGSATGSTGGGDANSTPDSYDGADGSGGVDPGWDGHRPEECEFEVPFFEVEGDGSTGDEVLAETVDTCTSFAEYTDDQNALEVHVGVEDASEIGDVAHLEIRWPVGFASDYLDMEQTIETATGSGLVVTAHPPDGEGSSLTSEGRQFKIVFVPRASGTSEGDRVLVEVREVITEGSYRDQNLRMHITDTYAFLVRLPELDGAACELWRNWSCERNDPSGCSASCDGAGEEWTVECPTLQDCTCSTPEGEQEVSVLGSDCDRCENAFSKCTE